MAITTSTRSVADLANNALTRMGFKLRVGSLLEGSDHARHLLDVYGQTRDEMLEAFDYDFAERAVTLTLQKSAPPAGYFPPNLWNPATNPPPGFLYQYAYPPDAIKIRTIKFTPLFAVNYDPQPNNFTEANDDNFVPPQRVLLTNVPNAICTYTGRVTDPATWSVNFSDALASKLAVLLGPVLVGLDSAKLTVPEDQVDGLVATTEQR